jgi:hypothetical protein
MLKNCKVIILGNSEVAFFLIHPVEHLHSFPRNQLNKSHGGHVAVPDKSLIKIILNWNINMAAVTSCVNAPYDFCYQTQACVLDLSIKKRLLLLLLLSAIHKPFD